MQKASVHTLATGSIAVALAVLALKLAAWAITGSVALLSDALESVVNVIAAAIAWYAIRVAAKPADEGHPFGHHKAEYMSAVAEGVLIVLSALFIVRESLAAIADPMPLDAPIPGLAINGIAAILNAIWASVLLRHGRLHHSPALVASARHLLADVWTSASVIVGLGIALATGWLILDALLALGVAANILREGWKVISGSLDGLMDAAASAPDQARIEQIVKRSAGGALQIHDVRTRRSGAAIFIEFHLVVDSAMTVGAAHEICDTIEQGLAEEFPGARTHIHVEPDHKIETGGWTPEPGTPTP